MKRLSLKEIENIKIKDKETQLYLHMLRGRGGRHKDRTKYSRKDKHRKDPGVAQG